MPELPEVEFAANRLRNAAVGRTIATAKTFHPSAGRSLPPAACEGLQGRQIVAVDRRAKIQLVTFDNGDLLEVHFRMTGDWAFGAASDAPERFERVRLALTDGSRISLLDSRAFAVVRFHLAGSFTLPDLGPEPLSAAFTPESLKAALANRRSPIKPTLLDQRVVAGLGNIYAAEALWEAQVSPRTRANLLTRAQRERLVQAIRVVLTRAQGHRYHTSAPVDALPEFCVYDRAGESCVRCKSAIKRFVQAGRSTYYCPTCQSSRKAPQRG
ncbi:MAG: bifunctional DNA-formamidopyrimidine glycosylase/DNA-(apurinic or apyrimidinic site) lyase [Gemmatimonadaceae bacterium]|nr:bifunctional DNA-formamidopyrimidine glycosylase/DNA-(apurinic or apyrimidinic site) lyase [Gemmatimonadaceae bacterium]